MKFISLSFISKLIEKAALKFLVPQFNRIESFSLYNSAYKTNFSIETLLKKMTSNILCSIDKQQISFLVLLYPSAAFDSVRHSKLFTILKNVFNISKNCLKWIQSYISHRYQKIKINFFFSREFPLNKGVPTGSCFGPVVFLAYISHLHTIIKEHNVEVGGFAHNHQLQMLFNTNLSSVSNSLHILENCIKAVR